MVLSLNTGELHLLINEEPNFLLGTNIPPNLSADPEETQRMPDQKVSRALGDEMIQDDIRTLW